MEHMTKDRLAAFMDAVLAIIMTILVLELPKPEIVNWENISALGSSYFCYSLSFFWLGIMWINLHNEWHGVVRITKTVVWLSLILLFVSSWIPYSISVINLDVHNKLGQGLYGMSVLLVTFANLLLSYVLGKCHEECFSAEDVKRYHNILKLKYIPDILIKIIGLILTVTVFPMAIMLAVLVTMVWIVIPAEKWLIK